MGAKGGQSLTGVQGPLPPPGATNRVPQTAWTQGQLLLCPIPSLKFDRYGVLDGDAEFQTSQQETM